MVARFFLGIAEASISPGFSLITSLWYRTSEQPWRHGLWFCGNSLSSVFSGLIGYGIYHIHDSLASWKVRVVPAFSPSIKITRPSSLLIDLVALHYFWYFNICVGARPIMALA
jgi:MFS family permease